MLSFLTAFTAILFSQPSRADMPFKLREEKIITITVNQYSQVFIGRDTLTISDLSKELENRLWRNYLGTGKTYDRIKLNFTKDVSQPTRLATVAAIKSAQKNVLKEISLEKHKKLFEDLAPDKQEKMRKQFPVLFQQV